MSARIMEHLVTDDLRKKADELLEQWAREYAIDQKINAKETRPQPHARIPEYRASQMDQVMTLIKKVNPDYFYALKEYYLRGTVKAVAKALHWSETKAKQAKSAGFDMVVLILEERGL
jgi:hypothetical protein